MWYGIAIFVCYDDACGCQTMVMVVMVVMVAQYLPDNHGGVGVYVWLANKQFVRCGVCHSL
jgi:hypothetical protein